MNEGNSKCSLCGAFALEATILKCGGYCMRCFKVRNNGFSPSALESIKERGLTEGFNQWREIVRKGVPNVRNPLVSGKLNETVKIIYPAITGSLRSTGVYFDRSKVLGALQELQLVSEGELKQYLAEIEPFIVEFARIVNRFSERK